MKKYLLILLSLLVPAVLIFFLFRAIDFHQFWTSLKQMDLAYFLIGCSFPILILILTAFQWNLFVPENRKLRFQNMFSVVSVFAMLVNTVPFWGGHLFGIYLLGEKEKLGKSVALSIITLEQMADGFGKIVMFGMIALFYPLPDWIQIPVRGGIGLIFLAYVILFALAYRYRNSSHALEVIEHSHWKRLGHFFSKWAHHLQDLRDLKKMFLAIAIAFAMKSLEVGTILMVQKSFHLQLPWISALLVHLALGVAMSLPVSPGRFGIFEGAVFLTYQHLGIDTSGASAIGLAMHLAHTLPFVLVGSFLFLKMGLRHQGLFFGKRSPRTLME